MFQHQDGTFLGAGDLPLYYQTWSPPQPAIATLTMLHGLGAHSGLYGNLVDHLVPQGIAVYGFDLRGHGRSPGQRGYFDRWSDLRQDLGYFQALIQDQHPGLPHFLWGHSLGAVIALDYTVRHPQGLHGLITSALPLGEVSVARYKLWLARLLSAIWPRFSLSTGIDLSRLSQDPQYLEVRLADPWRHRRGTARLTTEFLRTTTWLRSQVPAVAIPLLMLHGGQDCVAVPEGSRSFYQQVLCADKQYIEYPGAYHDLHADVGYREMLIDLLQWLLAHQGKHKN